LSDLTVDHDQTAPGDPLAYTLTLRNLGLAAASPASVTIPVPAGTSFLPGSLSGGATYDAGSDTITWSGTVASLATKALGFGLRVDAGVPDVTVLTTSATLAAGSPSRRPV